jgi:hypothetical protein
MPVLKDFEDDDDVEPNTKVKWWDADNKQEKLLKPADDESCNDSELRSDS